MCDYVPERPKTFDQKVDDARRGLEGPIPSELQTALDKIAGARPDPEFKGMAAPPPHLEYYEKRALERAGFGAVVVSGGTDHDATFVAGAKPKDSWVDTY